MENEQLIAVEVFCTHHDVEPTFIDELCESGLLQVTSIEEKTFVPLSEMQKLEQLVRMHYDLNINREGLEAISHLLHRLKTLQSEVNMLRNRLRVYEIHSPV
jgi:chaperone modulatory protein CbpM